MYSLKSFKISYSKCLSFNKINIVITCLFFCCLTFPISANDSLKIIELESKIEQQKIDLILLREKIQIYEVSNNKIVNILIGFSAVVITVLIGIGIINYFTNNSLGRKRIENIKVELKGDFDNLKNEIYKKAFDAIASEVKKSIDSKISSLNYQIDGTYAKTLSVENKLIETYPELSISTQIDRIITKLENGFKIRKLDPYMNYVLNISLNSYFDELKAATLKGSFDSYDLQRLQLLLEQASINEKIILEKIIAQYGISKP